MGVWKWFSLSSTVWLVTPIVTGFSFFINSGPNGEAILTSSLPLSPILQNHYIRCFLREPFWGPFLMSIVLAPRSCGCDWCHSHMILFHTSQWSLSHIWRLCWEQNPCHILSPRPSHMLVLFTVSTHSLFHSVDVWKYSFGCVMPWFFGIPRRAQELQSPMQSCIRVCLLFWVRLGSQTFSLHRTGVWPLV